MFQILKQHTVDSMKMSQKTRSYWLCITLILILVININNTLLLIYPVSSRNIPEQMFLNFLPIRNFIIIIIIVYIYAQ